MSKPQKAETEAVQPEPETEAAAGAAGGESPATGKVKFESRMAREEAVAYFEALVAGLKQGSLSIRQGAESVTLTPGDEVGVEVKASSKTDKEKISFEISWRRSSAKVVDLEIAAK